jgi:enoyl-CoA hydratase/carnithine racemase
MLFHRDAAGSALRKFLELTNRDDTMSHIESESNGAVRRITINRPEKKNALTAEMYMALSDALEKAESAPEVRVMLLHGAGEAFTAGNDLVDFLQKPWKGQDLPPAVRFIRAVVDAKKPIVAAVHGATVGIGTTILLHCDLVFAAENTKFLMPFINLGIVPEAGSTVLLPLLIGHQRAAELLMLAVPFTAQRAYELGLVNAVVAQGELLTTAASAAQKLAAKPPVALRACKELLKRTYKAEVDRAIQEEVTVISGRLDSPESREALNAFSEKREPDFSKFW